MKYRLVIFDMDGTLADTSPGILNSHRYAHISMGKTPPDTETLMSVIGGPLLRTYEQTFGFAPEDARQAVTNYRSYYQEKGIFEADLYPGIKETLIELKNSGCMLGVASLKAERFLKPMLERMGVAEYFDIIFGMDEQDTRTKADLIQLCMNELSVPADETVLVGDSIHDQTGAEQAGVAFLGVTYGFGFMLGERLYMGTYCNSPSEIKFALEVQ